MWRPKQIINDIWRAGDTSRTFVIGWLWWTLWLVMTPFYWFANSAYTSAETPEAVRDASIALLVADVLGATAAVLAIVVAIQATRRLDRRAVARTRPPDPAWRIAPPVERREDGPFPAYPACRVARGFPRGCGEDRAHNAQLLQGSRWRASVRKLTLALGATMAIGGATTLSLAQRSKCSGARPLTCSGQHPRPVARGRSAAHD